MFARRSIRPFSGSATAVGGAGQSHEHRAARGVANIADDPIAPCTSTVGEITPADIFGIASEMRGNVIWSEQHNVLLNKKGPPLPAGQCVEGVFVAIPRR